MKVPDSAILELHEQGLLPGLIASRLRVWPGRVRRVVRTRPNLTRLNETVTRRYLRCQEKGGCIPSKSLVMRPFPLGYMELPECSRCGVPMRGKAKSVQLTWTGQKNAVASDGTRHTSKVRSA